MGNDGGTIIKRRNTGRSVREENDNVKKQSRKDNEEVAFGICALSCQPLYKSPIVSDYKGKLYLKEKILEYLLAFTRTKKETGLESDTTKPAKNDMAHIKGLQDLVDLKISWDPVTSQIECPVTGTTNKSLCYLRSCGCVMSYAFINELSNKNSVPTFPCPLCEKPFNREYDMVVLNPLSDTHLMGVNNDSYEKLKAQHLSHSKRSLKKSKKTKSKIGSGAQESLDTKKRSSSESCASTNKKQRV